LILSLIDIPLHHQKQKKNKIMKNAALRFEVKKIKNYKSVDVNGNYIFTSGFAMFDNLKNRFAMITPNKFFAPSVYSKKYVSQSICDQWNTLGIPAGQKLNYAI
jgi:hypothetical protein